MVSNGTRHKIDAALAHPAASAGKSAIDAGFPRNAQDAVVFIIDDDVAVREALHNLLRDVRLQAEGFGSPTEFLASKLPDAASCLVLDIRLPGVGGLDFQAELARVNIDIPIIFMTGYADIPMAARAMKAGAVDFLTKPFREQDMLDAVAIAIERDRIRREGDKAASGMRALFETLSPREREVMALVTSGLMNKQVAAKTGLAESTVKIHRGQVMRKMGAKSLADLIKMAEIIDVQGNSFRHRPSSRTRGRIRRLCVGPSFRENRPRIDRRFCHAGLATRGAGRAGLETAALEPEAASTGRADERWWAVQIAKHGDRRDQQRNKIKFRRLSLVGSRAGQAIEDTRSARAGQSRQSISRQFPAAAYIPKGGRSHAKRVHGKTRSTLARSLSRRRFLRTRL